METEKKADILNFLRNWRTLGELKSRFGIGNPEAYVSELVAAGYGIRQEKREVGLFRVPCFKWNGTLKMG